MFNSLKKNFDHFKEGPPVDMKRIFPEIEHPLKWRTWCSRASWTSDQKNEEPVVPESVNPPVQKDVESAVPQNVEAVGAPNEEAPVKRTYEDKFMEEVRNLTPVREWRKPRRFRDDDDDDCLLVNSEMEEPKTVHEALNGEQSS